MIKRLMIAGGGTGGHLFPAIALIEEFERRGVRPALTFVGTARGIENVLVPKLGATLELLEVLPLKGKGPLEFLHNAAVLPRAGLRALALLIKHKPDLVVGVGGYASGPMLLAAIARNIPTAILEQNAVVGLTNRMLAPFVGRAYVTFEQTAAQFGAKRVRVSGNPVRRAFVEAARFATLDSDGFEAKANTLLVLGGSQGARALNECLPNALAQAVKAFPDLRIVHQTGSAMNAQVEQAYKELGVKAEVVSFIDDMARAYASARIVIARAGATTLAELSAIGRPAILIPFPQAADNHQTLNAQALERAGGALLVEESELTPDLLFAKLERLLSQPEDRRVMAEASRKWGRPDAAASIVDDLLSWLDPTAEAQNESVPDLGKQATEEPPSFKPTPRSLVRNYRPVQAAYSSRARMSALRMD